MRDVQPLEFDAPLRSCPFCKSARIPQNDVDFRGVHIAKCSDCGIKFMNPQYTDGYLARLYGDYDSAIPGRDEGHERRASNFALIEKYVRPGHLLSIGSGSGDEVKTALSRGWTVDGYDVDPEGTARLAQQLGITMYSGDINDVPLASDAYDCVYMDQVMEHPKNPADYLVIARRVLKPNGILYIGVPNIGSLAARYQTLVGKAHLKPRRGRHYDTWHHMFYYSPGVLKGLLEKHFGFEVLALQGDPRPDTGGKVNAAGNALRRRVPLLDSTMRLVARPKK